MHKDKVYLLCEAFGIRGYPGVSEVVLNGARVTLVDDHWKRITAKVGSNGRTYLSMERKNGPHPSAYVEFKDGRWTFADMGRAKGHNTLRLIPAN